MRMMNRKNLMASVVAGMVMFNSASVFAGNYDYTEREVLKLERQNPYNIAYDMKDAAEEYGKLTITDCRIENYVKDEFLYYGEDIRTKEVDITQTIWCSVPYDEVKKYKNEGVKLEYLNVDGENVAFIPSYITSTITVPRKTVDKNRFYQLQDSKGNLKELFRQRADDANSIRFDFAFKKSNNKWENNFYYNVDTVRNIRDYDEYENESHVKINGVVIVLDDGVEYEYNDRITNSKYEDRYPSYNTHDDYYYECNNKNHVSSEHYHNGDYNKVYKKY